MHYTLIISPNLTHLSILLYTFSPNSRDFMDKVLLVDFDGTLFKSDEFHNDIFEFLNNKYKVDLEIIKEAYSKAKSDGKPHSLKKQLKIIGFKNVSGLIKEVQEYLIKKNKDYLYKETQEFINKYRNEIIIYTYADPNYFRFKLKVSGLSKIRIPSIIVDKDKNEFIKDNLHSCIDRFKSVNLNNIQQILWIDDKIKVFKNPIDSIQFVRIKREGDKYSKQKTPKHVLEIKNLLHI